MDVELRAAPLLAEGEPVGKLGVYHDITELRRQKQYYEALLDVSPAAVVRVEPREPLMLRGAARPVEAWHILELLEPDAG